MNRKLQIYQMNYYDGKDAVTKWLQLWNYDATESLLNVPA